MSGTDHGKATDKSGRQPTFVLVDPQMGENIGAAARAMWNFGLDRLRLVNPRDGWPNPKAAAMASGAGRVLDAATCSDTTDSAIGDLNYVYATTARPRDLTITILTPADAMAEAHQKIADGERVGVLFGPERAGLQNTEVVRANALVSVPVNPAFGSLNLAQCVLLMAYEWQQQASASTVSDTSSGLHDPATAADVKSLADTLEEALESKGFFWPTAKADSMVMNLRNMISRLPLTGADVRTFHGIIRSLTRTDRPPR